jgi:uncharacterized alkaline shock family protein YloU
MTDQQPKITPDVLTAAVWDAIKDIPGVADLHRNPFQQLGERVKLDWYGPVRLTDEDGRPLLEVHIVVAAGHPLPAVAQATKRALHEYTRRALAMTDVAVNVFVDDIVDEDAPRPG